MATGKYPQRQAVAIALSNARRHPRAFGGQTMLPPAPARMGPQQLGKPVMPPGGDPVAGSPQGMPGMPIPPAWMQNQARPHVTGLINAPGAGRRDNVPLDLLHGSYVIPADVVSGFGQGNTQAGAGVLGKMFPMPNQLNSAQYARGGRVPIVAAGGEYVVHPHTVANYGKGDLKKGHAMLDAFVKSSRAKQIAKLKKLPGPRR